MNFFQQHNQDKPQHVTMPSQPVELVLADEIDMVSVAPSAAQVEVETVVEVLSDRRARVRHTPLFWLWMAAGPLSGLLFVIFLVNGDVISAGVSLSILFTARLLQRQSNRLQEERAARQNSQMDKRWAGALSEALEWPNRRIRNIAGLLLTEFLPALREDAAKDFSDESLNCLYRRLRPFASHSNPELARAILRALPYIGTEAALPFVERLAAGPVFTFEARRVREAARASLALLERRAAEQRAGRQILAAAQDAPFQAEQVITTQAEEAEQPQLDAMAKHVDMQMEEIEAERRRLQKPGMRIGYLVASWGVIVPYTAFQTYVQFAAGHWQNGLACSVLTALGTQLYRLTLNDDHKRLARRLAKMDDVRCIGRLAEALEWPDTAVQHVAIAALTRLLPRVKATDNVLQTVRQRANLNRMLVLSNARRHADFMVAILKALKQVGDVSSVPYVKQLAAASPTSARQRKVCDEARDCLEFLETRAELNRSSQTLLRASAATPMGAETLVRPAGPSGALDRDELLRADTGSLSSTK